MIAMPSDLLVALGAVLFGLAVGLGVAWLMPLWDRFASRHVADLVPTLEDLNMSTDFIGVMLRWWAVALLAAVLIIGVVFKSPLLALPVIVVLYQTPRMLIKGVIARRKALLRDQLVNGCIALANATRAGLALPQGLESILPETPEPLATEFRRILAEFQHGRPFADCLRDAQQRLKLQPFTLFSSAILACLERGGKVTEALERISKSLQENQRLERKLEADTASGQMVIRILAFCPLAFFALFYLLDPVGTSLLVTTIQGQILLFVAAVLVYIAVYWARLILNLDRG